MWNEGDCSLVGEENWTTLKESARRVALGFAVSASLSCDSPRATLLPVLIQTRRGAWADDAHQPTFGHGGNARDDEEVTMSDTRREPPSGSKRLYWHIDPDWTDEEIDAWAERFVDAVLGDE